MVRKSNFCLDRFSIYIFRPECLQLDITFPGSSSAWAVGSLLTARGDKYIWMRQIVDRKCLVRHPYLSCLPARVLHQACNIPSLAVTEDSSTSAPALPTHLYQALSLRSLRNPSRNI